MKDNNLKEEFPDISQREFAFIRSNSGFSQETFAKAIGVLSRSTICRWESEREMKPWQIKKLMEVVPEDLFNECRRRFAKREEAIRKYYEKRQQKGTS